MNSKLQRKLDRRMIDYQKIEQAVRSILEAIGEDPDREGLLETPRRVAALYEEITAGLGQDLETVLTAKFHVDHDELVLVKDITFSSICEHHLLPFYGQAHIAYRPRGSVVTGLSKLARLVDAAAKQPQIQERMTNQIADALSQALEPQGVFVAVKAEHLCMTVRGVKKPGSHTVTIATRGIYRDPAQAAPILGLLDL